MGFKVPEKFRVKTGPMKSESTYGNNGYFNISISSKKTTRLFTIIASDGNGWEHVSVSLPDRCPTWPEMCHIKDLFWCGSDAVIQIHPPASEYINNHKYCLHLFRKSGTNHYFDAPPSILVGF